MTKHRLKTSPFWAIAVVAALGMGLSACGGGGSDDTSMTEPEPTPQEQCVAADGRWNADDTCTSAAELAVEAVSNAITEAKTAVDALSDTSTDAEVTAAQGLVTAARTALSGANLLSTSQAFALDARLSTVEGNLVTAKAGIEDHRQMVAEQGQHMSVSGAVDAAMTVVAGLSATSTDAEVEAAEALIAAAKTALTGADLLSGSQVLALNTRILTIEANLVTAKAEIADHRKMIADEQQRMDAQRMAANTAIGTANTAVAGLSATSTDAEVEAAKGAIQDAKDAVAAATDLSQSDRDGLSGRISNIETTLANTESDIAGHRQMVADNQQRMGVGDAIDAAMAAVGDLTAMSTDEEVNAAKGLIATAKTALSGATSILTAEQALALQARISTIERSLATTEMAIAAHRDKVKDDAEKQRMADVADARSRAMQSYMDADADATKAEEAADAAEEASPGSQGAMDARDAAEAARKAADDAKAAYDAIMDGMTKAEADAQATEAANQAGTANSEYMTAQRENDAIQTAKTTADEGQRVADVKDATDAASDAATNARTAASEARTAATNARTAATAANAAYMRAVAARTDRDEAKKQADAAEAAATEAEKAAMAAEMAADAAEAAHMGIDAEGSAEDAETAQMTAETKQGEAETAQGTASTQYMTASTAKGMADTAAMTHVLSLFLAANGAHVPDLETTMTTDETAVHVASVGSAMAMVAGATAGNQAAGATNAATFTAGTAIVATATWPGDIADDPETDADESFTGKLAINLTVNGGTAIPFETRESRVATDLNMDGDTTDDGEAAIIQTARKIADLGVFQGYDMWEDDGTAVTNAGDFHTGDGARVIVFHNKTKDDPPVTASDAVTARTVENVAVSTTTLTKLGTKSGTSYTGAEYTPTGEPALMGTLTCPSGTTCSVDATTAADGTVTINAVTGYVFSGSREAKAAVTAMDAAAQAAANNDYLVFGLWLDESNDGTTDTFGAFAVGGANYAVNVQNAVTGTATYTGNAAGAHHKTGEGVNWFHGDATLTANFGAIDTDAERATDPAADTSPGTISGEISNIRVNGGDPLSDSIYLRQANLTDGTPTFNGMARMGAGEIQGDDTVEYPYNGTWSGSFYGATADDTDTTDVNESVTAPLAAAGTFGVTRSEGTGDDMVVESYVGAFGAHCTTCDN